MSFSNMAPCTQVDPKEKEISDARYQFAYYGQKADSAHAYLPEKPHTALIITCAIVKFLKENRKVQSTPDLTSMQDMLTTSCRMLLQMRCRREKDSELLEQTRKEFDDLFGINFDNSDDTECSCDDCHNHTCSTYGPLGGCRRVRDRD